MNKAPNIDIQSHSGVYTLQTLQHLPVDLGTAWDFLSRPENLARITPPHMGFHITSPDKNPQMYPGRIITYKISPFRGVRLNWVTEITHVAERRYFVDEQRFGPYAFWHHRHLLREIPGGTEMTDIVTYKIPLGFIGHMMHGLVRRKLTDIFTFRYHKLKEIFGSWNDRT
jgi:ligand-binding SRPBCC domain-containing protein